MKAIIEANTSGTSWTVRTSKGIFSGFGERRHAENFCRTMRYVVVEG